MRCAVYGCSMNNKNGNDDTSYHSFPRETQMCQKWVYLCHRRDKFNTKTARICSKHFKKNDFMPKNPLYEQYGISLKIRRLKEEVVPSVLLPFTEVKSEPNDTDLCIQSRPSSSSDELIEEENIKLEEPMEDEFEPMTIVDSPTQTVTTKRDYGIQADVRPTMVNCKMQTDEITPTQSQLLKQIKELEIMNWKQQKIIESIGHIFGKGQLKKLRCPEKRVTWSTEDIENAMAIYKAGPRAYRLLLEKQYPLPAEITLKKWKSKMKTTETIL